MTEDAIQDDSIGLVKLPPDRFFDPWRTAAEENVRQAVDEAIGMVGSYELHYAMRKRKRRAVDQANFEALVEAVMCDMFFCLLKKDERGTAIPLSKTILSQKNRYRPPAYNDTLGHVLKCLASPELGFITLKKGTPKRSASRGQRTLIRPGWRCADRLAQYNIELGDIGRQTTEEIVILKSQKHDFWDDGHYEEYDETGQTTQYRAELADINAWLGSADIRIVGAKLVDQHTVDVRQRRMRRIFTRGSFESGGRMFDGFWQSLTKQDRLNALLIDGEPVVELDYGQMAPRVVYGLMGVTPPAGDLYSIEGIDPRYREGIKKLFNAMLFAEKPLGKKPKGTSKLLPKNDSVAALCRHIQKAHPSLEEAFLSGIGHRTQFIESEVMMGVLKRLKAAGVVGLQIHDGVLVPESAGSRVMKIMGEVAIELAGVTIPVEMKSIG